MVRSGACIRSESIVRRAGVGSSRPSSDTKKPCQWRRFAPSVVDMGPSPMSGLPTTVEPGATPAAVLGRVPAHSGLRELGRGRSGVVFLGSDGSGHPLACKVFDTRGLTQLVQV